jgi:hypothetical protein
VRCRDWVGRQRQRRQATQDDPAEGDKSAGDFGYRPRIQYRPAEELQENARTLFRYLIPSYNPTVTFKKRRGDAGGNLTI